MTKSDWKLALCTGAVLSGRAIGGALRFVSRTVSRAYHAVDPDARWHLAQAPLLGLTLLARRRPPIRALPDDGRRPVVCVHGLAGHRGNFTPMRAWLAMVGRTRTYSIGFAPGVDLERMAVALRADIQRIVEVNGLEDDDQVDLVCHSMGGIVARLALEDPATARRVATLVTLGTPHAGTHPARFGGTRHTLALRPGSDIVERLEAQLPWEAPRLVCFWSSEDVLIQPPEAARIDGADNRRLEGVTHLGFMLNPAVFLAVAAALTDRRLLAADDVAPEFTSPLWR